ncbi:MAG: tape measure protein, partial [Sulfuricella sp.]
MRTATGDLNKFGQAGAATEKQAVSLGRAFKGMGSAVGVAVAALASSEIIRAADAYKNLNARLQLVSRTAAEFARAQSEVLNIAQRSGVALQQTGDLYASLARSTQALGVSQDELLGVTESINQALIISGTSAESAQAALVQLGQGFAAGALRGEELNSVLEQAPRLAQAIADGLGVPIGQLRDLGAAGELTAEKVFGALQGSSARLKAEFDSIPLTVERATTQAANSLSVLIGALDESTGATDSLAQAIGSVAGFVKELAQEIQRASKGAEDVGLLARAFTIISQTVRVLYSDVVFVFKGIGREIGAVAAQLAALGR